jgi:hypothetical protein
MTYRTALAKTAPPTMIVRPGRSFRALASVVSSLLIGWVLVGWFSDLFLRGGWLALACFVLMLVAWAMIVVSIVRAWTGRVDLRIDGGNLVIFRRESLGSAEHLQIPMENVLGTAVEKNQSSDNEAFRLMLRVRDGGDVPLTKSYAAGARAFYERRMAEIEGFLAGGR